MTGSYEIRLVQKVGVNPYQLGFTFDDLTKGVNNLLAVLQQLGPVLSTVNKNSREIEAIIRVAAANEQQINTIVQAASKLAPVIDVVVKQLDPLVTPASGQEKSPLQKYAGAFAWVAENPGPIAVGAGLLAIAVFLSGVYALTQFARPKEKKENKL